MRFALQDMVDEVLRNAEEEARRELSPGDQAEKTASAADPEVEDYVEKVASAVEWLVAQLREVPEHVVVSPDPVDLVSARFKTASSHKGIGGGQQFKQTVSKDGKQSRETGQAKAQPKSSALEGHPGMEGKASIHVDENDGMARMLSQHQPQISMSKKADREELKNAILGKLAGMECAKPNISNTTLPGPEGVTASGEGPSATGKGADLVSSIEKVIALTKGQAKALVRSDLGKVLDEPALSRSTDSVLHANLRNASQAGVKIAARSGAAAELSGRFAARRGNR